MCANTQTAAIEAASASWGIRHTGGARAAIQEARTTLKLSWRYMQAFEEEAAQLYSQAMDIDQMRDFAAELVEVDKADSRTAARNRSERAAGIVKLWTSSPTIAPIAGTRWAAYNAVTEYVDHYARCADPQQRPTPPTPAPCGPSPPAAPPKRLKAEAFRMLQTI